MFPARPGTNTATPPSTRSVVIFDGAHEQAHRHHPSASFSTKQMHKHTDDIRWTVASDIDVKIGLPLPKVMCFETKSHQLQTKSHVVGEQMSLLQTKSHAPRDQKSCAPDQKSCALRPTVISPRPMESKCRLCQTKCHVPRDQKSFVPDHKSCASRPKAISSRPKVMRLENKCHLLQTKSHAP